MSASMFRSSLIVMPVSGAGCGGPSAPSNGVSPNRNSIASWARWIWATLVTAPDSILAGTILVIGSAELRIGSDAVELPLSGRNTHCRIFVASATDMGVGACVDAMVRSQSGRWAPWTLCFVAIATVRNGCGSSAAVGPRISSSNGLFSPSKCSPSIARPPRMWRSGHGIRWVSSSANSSPPTPWPCSRVGHRPVRNGCPRFRAERWG